MDLSLLFLNLGRKSEKTNNDNSNVMISPKIIKAKGFWKSTLIFWLVFTVITNLIRIGILYKFDFSKFASVELSEDKIFTFIVSNLLLYFVLSFVLTYFNFKKNMEKNSSEK